MVRLVEERPFRAAYRAFESRALAPVHERYPVQANQSVPKTRVNTVIGKPARK